MLAFVIIYYDTDHYKEVYLKNMKKFTNYRRRKDGSWARQRSVWLNSRTENCLNQLSRMMGNSASAIIRNLITEKYTQIVANYKTTKNNWDY